MSEGLGLLQTFLRGRACIGSIHVLTSCGDTVQSDKFLQKWTSEMRDTVAQRLAVPPHRNKGLALIVFSVLASLCSLCGCISRWDGNAVYDGRMRKGGVGIENGWMDLSDE